MSKEVYVKGHKWKRGKAGRHPGYWRDKRPKGKKLIVGKKPIMLYPVYDEQGYRRGWRRKKR